MSCNGNCTGNCRQGRDCPARVAPIGARVPRYPETLREPQPHERTRDLIYAAGAVIACVAVSALLAWGVQP